MRLHTAQPQVYSIEGEMSSRKELTEALSEYVSDTFEYIKTVQRFIFKHHEWKIFRKTESRRMTEIGNKNKNRINPAFKNKIKNTFTPGRAEREEAELETELSILLQSTLSGLQTLQEFLDAVEKLSVTSVHVFQPDTVLNVSEKYLIEVQEIISVCVKICPLLLLFKRDNKVFFTPRLQNLEVLQSQLDAYIINVKTIYRQFTDSPLLLKNPDIQLNKCISEEDKMLSHIKKLQELRMDEAFKTVFLFQGEHFAFTKEIYLHKKQMNDFLSEVEQCAKELDNMKKGREISGVVSSVLGVGGGVASIIGLALIPVTLGASTVLIAAGAGVAGLSGVTSIATVAADATVNNREMGKAKDAFDSFENTMNDLQVCLSNIIKISCARENVDNTVVGSARLGATAISVVRCADTVIDVSSAGAQIAKMGRTGTMVASKVFRGGLIAVNALFIGFDLTTIALNSMDLQKGKESESSKLIRAKAALWRSEIYSWEKMCESVEQGLQSSQEKLKILLEPFCCKLD